MTYSRQKESPSPEEGRWSSGWESRARRTSGWQSCGPSGWSGGNDGSRARGRHSGRGGRRSVSKSRGYGRSGHRVERAYPGDVVGVDPIAVFVRAGAGTVGLVAEVRVHDRIGVRAVPETEGVAYFVGEDGDVIGNVGTDIDSPYSVRRRGLSRPIGVGPRVDHTQAYHGPVRTTAVYNVTHCDPCADGFGERIRATRVGDGIGWELGEVIRERSRLGGLREGQKKDRCDKQETSHLGEGTPSAQ